MRVYDLARQLDMANKDLMEKLKDLGFDVRSHSSSLDDKQVRQILDSLGKKADTAVGPAVHAEPKAIAKPAPAPAAAPAPAPKPALDARAKAMEAIARAKERAAMERHKAQEEAQAQGVDLAPAPQEVDLGHKKAVLKAPEHQTVAMPAPAVPAAPAPAAPPKPETTAAAPTAPAVPAPRRPDQGRAAQPTAPVSRPPREREGAPRDQQRPRHEGPSIRHTVELQQLPSLPRSKGPVGRRGKEDLVVPAIEVMKLRPTRRGGPAKRATDKVSEEEAEKARKRAAAKVVVPAEKRIRPGRFLNIDTLEEVVEGQVGVKRPVKARPGTFREIGRPGSRQVAIVHEPVVIKLQGDLTVAEFASKINVQPAEVITKAMAMGEILTMNKFISAELLELLADEFKVKVEVVPESDEHDVEEFLVQEDPNKLEPRPPVVTVMGHVDHGKTTLLDAIRETNVAGGEFGGITQHIGAYRVKTARGEVVFLDTPGHEAFTAMRARGASVTDIVILVVAADDGLMPQTIEAINHAKAASVPIIVAINKIDLPGANIPKVRNALMGYGLLGEDLGGDTIICEVSAKARTNIDSLLEMILLQAEVMELKANREVRASGVVIESEIDPQRGISATILVQRGTLKVGDAFVCGDVSGRVRAMLDDHGAPQETALPAHPIRIIGLSGCPQVGENFLVLENERQARQIAQVRESRRRRHMQNEAQRPHMTLEGLSDYLKKDDKPKTLNLVLKADVQGSVEAVSQAILRLSNPKVNISILHSGVGAISESDVQLSMASDAVILGFNVRPDSAASDLAAQEKIEVKTYRVIYTLIEELQAAMLGMLDKKYREVPHGSAQIRQVFKISRFGVVAGCFVTSGTIARNDKARLVRDGTVVYEGSVSTLRRIKDDVAAVQSGYECGLTLADYNDYKEGDVVETYRFEEVAQVL